MVIRADFQPISIANEADNSTAVKPENKNQYHVTDHLRRIINHVDYHYQSPFHRMICQPMGQYS